MDDWFGDPYWDDLDDNYWDWQAEGEADMNNYYNGEISGDVPKMGYLRDEDGVIIDPAYHDTEPVVSSREDRTTLALTALIELELMAQRLKDRPASAEWAVGPQAITILRKLGLL